MLDTTYFNILDQLPGFIGWKDLSFRHAGCNRNLANILKLKDVNAIIGLSDEHFNPHDEKLIKFHRQNDELAISGETIKALHLSTRPYDGSYFYFVKKPIVNQENKITGLIYHCQEFEKSGFLAKLNRIDKQKAPSEMLRNHYYTHAYPNPYKLSTRELESLFLLLRGKSAKQIAEVLQLSKRTIESYVEQIKNKFGCSTKADLFYLAITAGYMNIIPPRFLDKSNTPK